MWHCQLYADVCESEGNAFYNIDGTAVQKA